MLSHYRVLSSEFTRREDRMRRFEQEARAASALNHPNILTIYEIGQAGDVRYMATEYVGLPGPFRAVERR